MALGAALAAGAAYADCPYPSAPAKLPDGATATLEEMVAGQKAVNAYDKAINEYVSCIDKCYHCATARRRINQMEPNTREENPLGI